MTALSDITSAFEAFKPPKRVSVSQAAAENFFIRQPGGYTGLWSPAETPYMVEPMDMLASRRYEAVCFIGPSRTGKTIGLVDAWFVRNIVCDPGDMLILQMTQDKAREMSRTRIDRAIRYSPAVARLTTSSGHDINVYDKSFIHGMFVKLGWPTVTQLSGSDYRYVALTDYDRMPDDIDGEGDAFALGLKRTQTYMSRGMCMVESSPGREITDPNWHPHAAHEGPPCGGIVGIYNRSDRRRFYWPCPDCSEYFEAKPGLELFRLPAESELIEIIRSADLDEIAREYARVICPHCGSLIGKKHKQTMNAAGKWLTEGQAITAAGVITGDPARSNIAGYWLGGVAAAYQSWHSLIQRYLQALREYALTGSELSLQTTTNTDQGAAYLSRALSDSARNSIDPEGRREPDLIRYHVPDGARFVVAAVDVQGGQNARFVVQVHAVGPHLEQWVIDRFAITESKRVGVDGGPAPIDPAGYPEDWDMLTERVILATYRTDTEGRELRVKIAAVDTGGEDGVTDKAYAWWRRLRNAGHHHRAMLVKGSSTKNAPLIRESRVGDKKKRSSVDVPLYMINVNLMKDAVATSLRRTEPGPGYYHFPEWLPASFFDELKAEVREANGTWRQIKKRNESLDLCGYIRAAIIKIGADRINWGAPPPWAKLLADNADSVLSEDRRAMKAAPAPDPPQQPKTRGWSEPPSSRHADLMSRLRNRR